MSTDTSTKDSYETYCNGGKFPPPSLPTSRGMLPLCRCLPMKPMILYIATTLENQGRRFWRCRDWQKKYKTCNEWIWDDELGPATRPMAQCYSAVSNSKEADSAPLIREDGNAHLIREDESTPVNGPVIREAESAKSGRYTNQHCNCGELWEKKKDKWKMKVLAEKKKVELLKWIIIASWLIFAVFFAKK
ncbi:hypothetical protein MtrunA17_Chr7g0255731 [Medicago truncatula]|uniref:Transmembrane protein, putative n=1 Tax=Medicago truncatula TaxID=3880 RepID=A2Q6E9_MEDTR|nr:hypothetical protein MtrDRAFT_AC183371g21v1 [Medicago truncatula]AES81139.1 transmembrane protein, putative [Medicago truncatula]RHN47694.1 hypothetical protein MtrunA17_Chr7g0255731 [Medicago truncatula]